MKKRRNFSRIALWCHSALAVFATFSLIVLGLALLGVSPEGLGMGLFLMFYFLLIPGLILGLAAIAFTVISPSNSLLAATLLLLLVGVTTELENTSNLSLFLILGYIASVVWAWKTTGRSSTDAE